MPEFKALGKVRALTSYDNFFRVGDVLEVKVVVNDGIDYKGQPTSGVIFYDGAYNKYPFVWSFDRFEIISAAEYEAGLLEMQAAAIRRKAQAAIDALHYEADDNDPNP